MRPLHAEIDNLLHGGFLGPVGKDRERIAGHGSERMGALKRRLDRLVPSHEANGMLEIASLEGLDGNLADFSRLTCLLSAKSGRRWHLDIYRA